MVTGASRLPLTQATSQGAGQIRAQMLANGLDAGDAVGIEMASLTDRDNERSGVRVPPGRRRSRRAFDCQRRGRRCQQEQRDGRIVRKLWGCLAVSFTCNGSRGHSPEEPLNYLLPRYLPGEMRDPTMADSVPTRRDSVAGNRYAGAAAAITNEAYVAAGLARCRVAQPAEQPGNLPIRKRSAGASKRNQILMNDVTPMNAGSIALVKMAHTASRTVS